MEVLVARDETASAETALLTFEQAVAQLDGLITQLESGQVELADAILFYERGAKLVQHCADLLDRTEAQITQLVVGAGGIDEKPLSVPAVEIPSVPASPPRSRAVADPGLFPGVQPLPAAADDVDPNDIPF